MKKLIITMALLAGIVLDGLAQTRFTTDGVIEYDKTVNMYALIKKDVDAYGAEDNFIVQAYDQYKKTQPQFRVLKSTLAFANNKTLFTPIEPETATNNFFNNMMVPQNNTIYTDVVAGTSITRKNVYEEVFLLKDSTRKINWKITSETRDIIGYTCRRANAVIMDSIYVVAFYTDEIPVSGGPESFTGLPGMILGVAIPHENITWFATKITDNNLPGKPFGPPTKGKPVDNNGLKAIIAKALKSWGTYANTAKKAFTL